MAVSTNALRTRWAAIGAAVAVSLGAGGVAMTQAALSVAENVFVPITPCRLADLRPAPFTVGPRPTALGAEEIETFSGRGEVGNCDLPDEASALVLNVTALDATTNTFLTFWPSDKEQPVAANLNPAPGQPPTPNAVTVRLGDVGDFAVYNKAGSVNLVIDVNGYYRDHEHDDRYPTRAEVAADIAGARTMWARVNTDGTLRSSSDGVSSAEYPPFPNTGTYVVSFPVDVSDCAYSVTPADDYTDIISPTAVAGPDLSAPLDADEVFVAFINDDTGNASRQYAFSITANC